MAFPWSLLNPERSDAVHFRAVVVHVCRSGGSEKWRVDVAGKVAVPVFGASCECFLLDRCHYTDPSTSLLNVVKDLGVTVV